MAAQPKKTKTSSSPHRSEKRRRGKTTQTSGFKKSILVVSAVFLMILMVVFGYFLGQYAKATEQTPIAQTYKTDEAESKKELLEALSKKEAEKNQTADETKRAKKSVPEDKRKEKKSIQKEEAEAKTEKKAGVSERAKRPKLAIIIDDVSSRSQLNQIKATGLIITPSIFPPSRLSGTSHLLAEGLKHYMVHLPMESGSAQFNKQSKTLKRTFSEEEIEARVKELRKLFPRARYVNNHTGSVFTDDYEAMERLYKALRKEGFLFVDSRTIGSSKVPQIAKAFGDVYVARDVFIDNVQSISHIHKQLEEAVKISKRRGYAIAIGHPHRLTMKALSSANDILKDVDLVYIDALYR